MTQAHVPVTHQGVLVGKAFVEDDGTIEIVMYPRNGLAKDVIRAIQAGMCDGLSISPNLIPAMPATHFHFND